MALSWEGREKEELGGGQLRSRESGCEIPYTVSFDHCLGLRWQGLHEVRDSGKTRGLDWNLVCRGVLRRWSGF